MRLPHRFRILDGLRHCTYGVDSSRRVILTLRHLPESESHHPVPVRLSICASCILIGLTGLHSGSNALVSIMITRMLLSLKRASVEGLGQSWGVDERESALDPPTSLRALRGVTLYRAQVSNVIPIPMETIYARDEQCHI